MMLIYFILFIWSWF